MSTEPTTAPNVDPPQDAAARASAPEHWRAHVVVSQKKGLEKRIARTMMKTVETYDLIGPGDRIMVAVSGGKDSYTLLDLLWTAKKKAPFRFDIIAVHLDQGQPGYDGAPLRAWLADFGAPYEILAEDTYKVVLEHTKPGGTYCSMCSRLRRGILYTAAARLGCNKIALGHHRDDSLETFMMNMMYAGKLQAMPATYTTDDGRFQVIRPLMDVAERDIRIHAERAGYPILPCNLCGSQSGLKRERTKAMLDKLEAEVPHVRQVMLNALKNVKPSHLLDTDVAAAWSARPAEIRPRPVMDRKAEHVPIAPAFSGGAAWPAPDAAVDTAPYVATKADEAALDGYQEPDCADEPAPAAPKRGALPVINMG